MHNNTLEIFSQLVSRFKHLTDLPGVLHMSVRRLAAARKEATVSSNLSPSTLPISTDCHPSYQYVCINIIFSVAFQRIRSTLAHQATKSLLRGRLFSN